MMKAIFKLKDNFNNLSGKELTVTSLDGRVITVTVPVNGFDFKGNPIGPEIETCLGVDELVEIYNH